MAQPKRAHAQRTASRSTENPPPVRAVSKKKRYEPKVADFIPYACHVDPHTILTKNGELLQMIRVQGFQAVGSKPEEHDLRAAVRAALLEIPNDSGVAFWIHTTRRASDFSVAGQHPDGFAAYAHHRWQSTITWDSSFTNDLTITVVWEGQSARIRELQEFSRALLPGAEKGHRHRYLEQAQAEMERMIQAFCERLQHFGARRLGMISHQGVYYSELLTFLGDLVNLHEVPMPMPVQDLSSYLQNGKLAVGFNVLELRHEAGEKTFATVLSLKEHKELSPKAIDDILQLSIPFTITQTLDFIPREVALEEFEEPKYWGGLGEDTQIHKTTGLNEFYNASRDKPVDYIQSQTSITLMAPSMEKLDAAVAAMVRAFQNLGLIAIREDMHLEKAYWAQLPGNFEFLTRLRPLPTRRAAAFSTLHHYVAGKARYNYWGPAVTVFPTATGTPYFFSFHREQVGHTLLLGANNLDRMRFRNFLCMEATKFQGRILILDDDRGGETMLRALGGKYINLLRDMQSGRVHCNPCLLPDTSENRQFLAFWLRTLCTVQDITLRPEEIQFCNAAVEYLYSLPEAQRRLSTVSRFWQEQQADELVELLSIWHGGGSHALFFDHPHDTLLLDHDFCGIDLTGINAREDMCVPVLLYLMQKIRGLLDGRPTILVLDAIWRLFGNSTFGPRTARWLENLVANNAIAFMVGECTDDLIEQPLPHELIKHLGTLICMPDAAPSVAHHAVFGLTSEEYAMLSRMRPEKGHVLVKHGGESVAGVVNLGLLNDVTEILGNDAEVLTRMETSIHATSADPDEWLPHFQAHGERKQVHDNLFAS
jgi:type IV secretion system protein VirB4